MPTQSDKASKIDRKQAVQERRVLRSESRWLQKALFALSKAGDDQEKLAKLRGKKREPLTVTIDGDTFDIDAVTEAVRDAVMERSEDLRTAMREQQALLRGSS